jgi:hypothetical protein
VCVLISITALTGCVEEQLPTSDSITGSGVTVVLPSEETKTIGLSQAFSQIQLINSEEHNLTPAINIFSVTGFLPDIGGKSINWLIIAKQGNAKKFIDIDKNRVLINTWSGIVPNIEILEKNIVLPEKLFIKHQLRLAEYRNAGWIFERLELKNGTYTLYLKNGSDSKIFVFNAENGEFIS